MIAKTNFNEENDNLLKNYLINDLFLSKEKWTKDFFYDVTENCASIILSIYQSKEINIDINKFYDMSIDYTHYGDIVKVVCGNIVSALWFSSIFPSNCDRVLCENKYQYNNKIYTFNEKTKKLIIKNIKDLN